jgi:Fur family peroxide stress response transcriptional regulator
MPSPLQIRSAPRSNRGLAESGLRPTPQRELIYNVLLQRRDHPTADEVYARVRAQMSTISLATVYNCLDALVQCGLVRAVNFEREPTQYCPNLHPHAHFHDEESGATHDIELPSGLLEQVRAVLPAGYTPSSVEITFRGSIGRRGSPVSASGPTAARGRSAD